MFSEIENDWGLKLRYEMYCGCYGQAYVNRYMAKWALKYFGVHASGSKIRNPDGPCKTMSINRDPRGSGPYLPDVKPLILPPIDFWKNPSF